MAQNTITAYLYAVKEFNSKFKELNKRTCWSIRPSWLKRTNPKRWTYVFKPSTSTSTLWGSQSSAWNRWRCSNAPIGNVISNADYLFLKKKLKQEENKEWYFVVRFLAATGARVSELVQIKVEHVQVGYYDIYTKGGKIRRIYIPKTLREETAGWLKGLKRTTGYLFLNRFGQRITTRGISQQLKTML